MSPKLYFILWTTYIFAGAVLVWMLWLFTRWERVRWLSYAIRLIAVVVIFTPAKLYEAPEFLVPAIFSFAFDHLLGNDEAAFSALVSLLVVGIISAVIYIMCLIILPFVNSRRNKSAVD